MLAMHFRLEFYIDFQIVWLHKVQFLCVMGSSFCFRFLLILHIYLDLVGFDFHVGATRKHLDIHKILAIGVHEVQIERHSVHLKRALGGQF